MFNNKFKISITLILCLITGIAFAATKLPKHYPSSFDISGTITKVLKKSRVIELDGTAYKLHPIHDIFTLNKNRKTTLYNLRPGMKIGGEFSTFQGKKVIYKIWILPKSYPTMKHTH